jgi:hypothetical protein
MDNLLTIALEAHNDDLNHHRRYEITVGRDLLDDWTLSIRFGRVGSGCQTQRFMAADQDKLRGIVRERLRRRRSAPKRIGCAYLLTNLDAAPGFDIATWLSDTLFPTPPHDGRGGNEYSTPRPVWHRARCAGVGDP